MSVSNEIITMVAPDVEDVLPKQPATVSYGDRYAEASVRLSSCRVEIDKGELVTVALGWQGDMYITYDKYNRVPPKMDLKKSIPDGAIAATRCLFDTERELVSTPLNGEKRGSLKDRRLRLLFMLDDLGRRDIINASRNFGNLPGFRVAGI